MREGRGQNHHRVYWTSYQKVMTHYLHMLIIKPQHLFLKLKAARRGCSIDWRSDRRQVFLFRFGWWLEAYCSLHTMEMDIANKPHLHLLRQTTVWHDIEMQSETLESQLMERWHCSVQKLFHQIAFGGRSSFFGLQAPLKFWYRVGGTTIKWLLQKAEPMTEWLPQGAEPPPPTHKGCWSVW